MTTLPFESTHAFAGGRIEDDRLNAYEKTFEFIKGGLMIGAAIFIMAVLFSPVSPLFAAALAANKLTFLILGAASAYAAFNLSKEGMTSLMRSVDGVRA
jgi:hypothetical protein